MTTRRDSSSAGVPSRSSTDDSMDHIICRITDDGSENDNHSDFHGAAMMIIRSPIEQVVPTNTEISRDVEIENSPTRTATSSSSKEGEDEGASNPSLPSFLNLFRRSETNHSATASPTMVHHQVQIDMESNHISASTSQQQQQTDDNNHHQFAWPSLGRAAQLKEVDDDDVEKYVVEDDDDHTLATTTEEESCSSNDISFETPPPMLYRLLDNVDYFSSIDEASVCSCPTIATDDGGGDDDDDIVCGISINDAKPIFERKPRKQRKSLFDPDDDEDEVDMAPSKLSWCHVSGFSLLFASGWVVAIKFL